MLLNLHRLGRGARAKRAIPHTVVRRRRRDDEAQQLRQAGGNFPVLARGSTPFAVMSAVPLADDERLLRTFRELWDDLQAVSISVVAETARLQQVCQDCRRLLRPWPPKKPAASAAKKEQPGAAPSAGAGEDTGVGGTEGDETVLARKLDEVLVAAQQARNPPAKPSSITAARQAAASTAFSHGRAAGRAAGRVAGKGAVSRGSAARRGRGRAAPAVKARLPTAGPGKSGGQSTTAPSTRKPLSKNDGKDATGEAGRNDSFLLESNGEVGQMFIATVLRCRYAGYGVVS